MSVNHALNFLVTICLLVGLTSIAVTGVDAFSKSGDGGFDTLVEKTAQTTPTEVEPEKQVLKVNDIALAVLLLDDYHPDPQTMKIKWYRKSSGLLVGSTQYDINTDFLNNRADTITHAILTSGSALSSNHEVKYNLEVNSAGSVSWVFEIWD